MRSLFLISVLSVVAHAKRMLLITSYKAPVLLDMVGIKETGPFVTNVYSTTCKLLDQATSNVTHFNPSVGWVAETDLGNGYYDRTYYNKAEDRYRGQERIYTDPTFKMNVELIELDICENIQ